MEVVKGEDFSEGCTSLLWSSFAVVVVARVMLCVVRTSVEVARDVVSVVNMSAVKAKLANIACDTPTLQSTFLVAASTLLGEKKNPRMKMQQGARAVAPLPSQIDGQRRPNLTITCK